MRWRVAAFAALVSVMAALAAVQTAAQAGRPPSGARIAILAYHDSRLLTLCPVLGKDVVRSDVWTDRMDARVTIGSPPIPRQALSIHIDPDRQSSVLLPLPAGSTDTSGDFDRLAVDLVVAERLDAAFRERKEYRVVSSPADADFVLIAESYYQSTSFGTADPPPRAARTEDNRNHAAAIFRDADNEWTRRMTGIDPDRAVRRAPPAEPNPTLAVVMGGDRALNWRQSILAIAVPAAAYRQHHADPAALVASSVWSDIDIDGFSRERGAKLSASPEALARRFHRKGRGLPDYLPVCAASSATLRTSSDAAAPGEPAATSVGETTAARPNLPTFRSRVTLVTVPMTVTGPDGAPVRDLPASAFRVFENDVEQKVSRLEAGDVPAHIAVIVDSSSSMRSVRDGLRAAAAQVARAIRPSDRVMVTAIDSRIRTLTPFTSDPSTIQQAFARLASGGAVDGGTRLYDGLALVAVDALERVDGRKAIVLVTDGVDTQSQLTNADGALAAIESSNTPVFVIRWESPDAGPFLPPGAFGITRWIVPPEGPEQRAAARSAADRFLEQLASGSGGRLLAAQPGADAAEMLVHIGEELSRQVVLGYYPANEAPDGSYRRIRVEAPCNGCVVRARAGYRAGAAR